MTATDALVTTPATIDVTNPKTINVTLLTTAEARKLCDEIRDNLDCLAHKLLELDRRRGWEALGYSSFRECVVAEFNVSQNHAYRLLRSAEVDENLKFTGFDKNQISQIPISHKEELRRLPPEQQASAIAEARELAVESGKPLSADIVKQVVTHKLAAESNVDEAILITLLKHKPHEEPFKEAERKANLATVEAAYRRTRATSSKGQKGRLTALQKAVTRRIPKQLSDVKSRVEMTAYTEQCTRMGKHWLPVSEYIQLTDRKERRRLRELFSTDIYSFIKNYAGVEVAEQARHYDETLSDPTANMTKEARQLVRRSPKPSIQVSVSQPSNQPNHAQALAWYLIRVKTDRGYRQVKAWLEKEEGTLKLFRYVLNGEVKDYYPERGDILKVINESEVPPLLLQQAREYYTNRLTPANLQTVKSAADMDRYIEALQGDWYKIAEEWYRGTPEERRRIHAIYPDLKAIARAKLGEQLWSETLKADELYYKGSAVTTPDASSFVRVPATLQECEYEDEVVAYLEAKSKDAVAAEIFQLLELLDARDDEINELTAKIRDLHSKVARL